MATTLTDIWKMIRGYMKPELTETTINTWFDDEVEAVGMENLTFYLACDNDFKRDMIRQMFIPNIQLALQRVFSSDFAVEILTFAERDKYLKEREERKNRKPDPFTSGEFTFENFVVGESNKLAYAAAHAVADEPAQHYNPLFIYGENAGIRDCVKMIRAHQPDAKIVYVKGDDFINEFIELIRANRGSEFRAKYRDADLFFVDDVQFVAGKEQVQNEFFHTFNALVAEMEGGSIGHVCFVNGVDCCILRAISDKADEESTVTYDVFEAKAAQDCADAVYSFIMSL